VIALSVGAAGVAHGVHYTVLGVGLVGVLALIGPQLVGGRRPRPRHDEHSVRVQALAAQLASGGFGVPAEAPAPNTHRWHPLVDHARRRYLPLAVVSSAAAAGVHAAVGPEHFAEQALFGVFFAGAALAQLGWSVLMVARPSRALLVAAVIGNAAVLALWLTTRTIGLPGLLPEPESLGPWDLSCAAWELIVVISASRVLRNEPADPLFGLRLPAWSEWEPLARVWALGSVLVLLALTLSGAGA